MKRFVNFLKIWDGVWSVPLAIFLFIGCGYGIVSLFGPEAGSMLPVYLQRLFYAALCLVICNFVVLFGMYFNFTSVFKFYAKDWSEEFSKLDTKTKLRVVLGIYFGYFLFFTLFLIFV
jgi:hypothetical protein